MQRAVADFRMAIRRIVVQLARIGLFHRVFGWIYQGHIRLAVAVGRRFRGTQAVYLTSGLASGARHIGISDVDIAMYGVWPEEEQFRLLKVFGALTVLLPLFDRRSLSSINTLEDVKALRATDLHMAMNFERGRQEWPLLWGEPVLQELPPLEDSRYAGAVYANLRRWWSELAVTTCGTGVTSRDSIFIRTVCYKAAAEIIRNERMLPGRMELAGRRALLEDEYRVSGAAVLGRLLTSADGSFLDRDADPCMPTMAWLLEHAERMHEYLRATEAFTPTAEAQVMGSPDDRIVAKATAMHIEALLTEARKWDGFRSAFLVPIASMFSPDGLGLVFEVDQKQLPTREQLKKLGAMHSAVRPPQRLAIFLLLQNAAYMLDATSALEFFHYTLSLEANPEVFLALSDPGYLLAGSPRPRPSRLGWTPFMSELFDEELTARRGAYRRFGLMSRPSALENLRNFLRFLQLTLIEQSAAEGAPLLPISTRAVIERIQERHPALAEPLAQLENAHCRALGDTGEQLNSIETPMDVIYRALTEETNDAC